MQVLEMEGRPALLWPGYDLRLDTIVLDMLHATLDTVVQVLGLRGEAVNQLAPSTVLESLRLTLEVHEAVDRG